MKFTVLGCRGAYPSEDEACSGYLIQHDDFNLLIDCGSGVVSELQKHMKLTELDAVVLSHYHADHFSDIAILQHGIMIECIVNDREVILPIYGHQEEKEFESLSYREYTSGRKYQENSQLILGPLTLTFTRTSHPVPCFAIRISNGRETIVYTADTAYNEQLVNFSRGANLLAAECSIYPGNSQVPGHMNSTETARLARNAVVDTLLLTHLPNYGNNQDLLEDAKKHFNGKIELAHTGYQWDKQR